ncbi:MAG: hypothetical protein ACK4HW_08510 [Roseinatronobacter sp.]
MNLRGVELSVFVLAADAHWREADWITRALAVVLGRRIVVEHLGCLNRIAVWRGVPYLWQIAEVRG